MKIKGEVTIDAGIPKLHIPEKSLHVSAQMILAEVLEKMGYQGLVNEIGECGCGMADDSLMACCFAPNLTNCFPAYYRDCPACRYRTACDEAAEFDGWGFYSTIEDGCPGYGKQEVGE